MTSICGTDNFLLEEIDNEIQKQQSLDPILARLTRAAVIPKAVDYHNGVNKLKSENIETSLYIINSIKKCYFSLNESINRFYEDEKNGLRDKDLNERIEFEDGRTEISTIVDYFFMDLVKKGFMPTIEKYGGCRALFLKCKHNK